MRNWCNIDDIWPRSATLRVIIFVVSDGDISTRHPCVRDISTRHAANVARASTHLSDRGGGSKLDARSEPQLVSIFSRIRWEITQWTDMAHSVCQSPVCYVRQTIASSQWTRSQFGRTLKACRLCGQWWTSGTFVVFLWFWRHLVMSWPTYFLGSSSSS